jgi:ubiquinone/menaquinone biosynthesis C-methylase UbiE
MSDIKESPKEVFDSMAAGWYNFRHYTIFPKELEEMASRWQKGKLLNVGCGHGADFLPFKDSFELYGADISDSFLEQCRKYQTKHDFHAELQQADMRHLPYEDCCFDDLIAVACLHHLAGNKEQIRALNEFKRILKPGGEAFITVWNKHQKRFFFGKKEVYVPWKSNGEESLRYYYLFTYREIKKIIKSAGFDIISLKPEDQYKGRFREFSRNICVLCRKPNE